MLFYLTESLIVDSSEACYNSIYRSIRYVAEQVEASNHLLTGDYNAIVFFRNLFQGDPLIWPLFNKIYQTYATAVVPQYITLYLEIVRTSPRAEREEGKKHIRQIEYSHFDSPDKASQARLICEDTNDCSFYFHILGWFKKNYAPNAFTKLAVLHGGGGNTSREIGNALDNATILIAIIDTDIKYPNCRPDRNGTYNQCKRLRRDEPFYAFVPINVHEIENLFPKNYIESCHDWQHAPSDNANKSKIDYLYTEAENILPYFDYKKGLKVCDDIRNKPDFYEYARKCYSLHSEMVAIEPDFASFLSRAQNDDVIYHNLFGGSGLISRVLQLIDNVQKCPLIPDLLSFQKDNWKMIGQELLNWGVCRSNERLY